MLLTLTLTRQPATDLGYLLHKHPERVQEFALPFGAAHVFYPEVSEPVPHAASSRRAAPARSADAPLCADPGARRAEALLGRRRRGREAARARRGLASQPSRPRADRQPLPEVPAAAGAGCARAVA